MDEQDQVQLDGDRDYCNPPFWQLCVEEQVLCLCPRPRPPLGLVLLIGGLGAVVVLGLLFLAQTVYVAAGAAALGVAAIAVIYALYSIKSGGGPWLRVDRDARRIDLPRAGGQIDFDDVVELQKVIGFNRQPYRAMQRITELILLCRTNDGQVRRWPLIGGIPGESDCDGIDGCARRLADAMGTAVRTYELPLGA
jgi:hypothetical protein